MVHSFLEILSRRPWKGADQIEHPSDFWGPLTIERFKEILNRAGSRLLPVELD